MERAKSQLKANPWLATWLVLLLVLAVWGSVVVARHPAIKAPQNVAWPFPLERVAPGWSESTFVQRGLYPWYRWDAVWYLRIVEEGYRPGDARLAWPPVYPLLTRMVGWILGGQTLLASFLVSQAALLGAGMLLYREYRELTDAPSAKRAMTMLLLFPSSFYLFIGYSESLFLFFVMMAWRSARAEHWSRASVYTVLATMTRLNGVFLALPLLYLWWRSKTKREVSGLLALVGIPAAFIGWGLFTKFKFGLAPWEALDAFWTIHSDWPWVGPWTNLERILKLSSTRIYYLHVDLAAVSLFLLLTIWVFRRLPREYGLLMLALGWTTIVKVSDGGFLLSSSRYLLPLFPGFLGMAKFGSSRPVRYAWWLGSGALILHLASEFIRWHWVA